MRLLGKLTNQAIVNVVISEQVQIWTCIEQIYLQSKKSMTILTISQYEPLVHLCRKFSSNLREALEKNLKLMSYYKIIKF